MARYPGVRFVWLMGADNLAQFDRWQDWEWIMRNVPIGIFARPGSRLAARGARAADEYARFRLPAEAALAAAADGAAGLVFPRRADGRPVVERDPGAGRVAAGLRGRSAPSCRDAAIHPLKVFSNRRSDGPGLAVPRALGDGSGSEEERMARITRRLVLGGLAGRGGEYRARAMRRRVRRGRPARTGMRVATSGAVSAVRADDLIGAAALGGAVSYVVADAKTGLILETRQGGAPMPPASTMKVITSLYALEHLGAGYRFPTRLIATEPVEGGKIRGDLVLAGGGDPELTTDDLGDMAAALRKAGVTGVTGRFLVWGGALPYLEAIDRSQPDWLGYNPAVSGLNLNFNRVNFVWKRAGNGYEVGMDARAERFAPPVYSARVNVADRDLPVYTYRKGGRVEEWTVARRALGKGGSRWLPVRRPELYAGDVFQTLARAQGVPLPAPDVVERMPGGTVLVERASDDLSVDPARHDEIFDQHDRRGGRHGGLGPARGDEPCRLGARDGRLAEGAGRRGECALRRPFGPCRRLAHLGRRHGEGAGDTGPRGRAEGADEGGAVPRRGRPQDQRPSGHGGGEDRDAQLRLDPRGLCPGAGGTDLAFAIFTGDVARRDCGAGGAARAA